MGEHERCLAVGVHPARWIEPVPGDHGDGISAKTYTYGIRNLAGHDNHDGTVTLYAITAQYSTFSNGEPDPDKLVTITDLVGATTLPTSEQFITLQWSGVGEVFRGVAFTPGSN